MKNTLIKIFMSFNAFLIRTTRGKIGSKLGTQSILILSTVGRKSGQVRSIPIAYFLHEGKYLIVESNWGKDTHADWYFNLKSQPHASLDVNGESVKVIGRFAEGEEYNQLWEYVTKRHHPYLEYQKMTTRKLPIAIFESIS